MVTKRFSTLATQEHLIEKMQQNKGKGDIINFEESLYLLEIFL